MKYNEVFQYRDYYNYNLSKAGYIEYKFSIIPTTFSYGFLLIPGSDMVIGNKDESKERKLALWSYVYNWNCYPTINTYLDESKHNVFLDKQVPSKYRDFDYKEKFNVLTKMTGNVSINGKLYELGVTDVATEKNKTKKVTVVHQITNRNIEGNDEIDLEDWKNDKGVVKYTAKRPEQGTNIRIFLSDDVLRELQYIFSVTLFSARMNEKLPKHETMDVRMTYYVQEEIPHLDLAVNTCYPYQDKVMINGLKIDADLCRIIEDKFQKANIIEKSTEPKSAEVLWKTPFDWYDVPKIEEDKYDENGINNLLSSVEFQSKRAVYMWVGHKKGNTKKRFLYVGIVGTRGNKGNSIGKRVLIQERLEGIAHKNKVIIDKIRFSQIDKVGDNVSVDEVLQTVEMQCINNMSALFGYVDTSKPKENTIHNLFEEVWIDGNVVSFELLNDKKRFHN